MDAHKTLSFSETCVLSSSANLVAKTLAAPLDRIKLLWQNHREIVRAGRLRTPYKDVKDCAVRTFKYEGIQSLWRGNLAHCLKFYPSHATYLVFKDKVRHIDLLRRKKSDPHLVDLAKHTIPGGLAGVTSTSLTYSLDYCRTRLANDVLVTSKHDMLKHRQFKNIRDVYKKTLQSDGIRGLHRGFGVSCVREFLSRGCYFGVYDFLKPIILSNNPKFSQTFCLGYVVTVFAYCVSYPLDTIARRMMMTSGEAVKYRGTIDCARQIARNEGYRAFMKGGATNVLTASTAALGLICFDRFRSAYIEWRLRQEQL